MSRVRFVRIALVFALLAAPGALPAGAAARADDDDRSAGFAAPGAFSQLWSFLTSLWEKAGCGIDPHGACAAGQGGSPGEAGCGIDPHGSCAPSQSTAAGENGSVVDPNGTH